MNTIIEYLSRKSRLTIILLGVVGTVYIGEMDFVTGPMVALLVFYLLPICFVAWFAGRWPGILIAALATAIWYEAKVLDPGSFDQALLVWNTIMRFGVFSAIAALTAEVADRKKIQQELIKANEATEQRAQALSRSEEDLRQQKKILQSILDSMGDGVIVVDAAGKIVLSNPAATHLIRSGLGRTAPEEDDESYQTYLPEMLTAYSTHEHPLVRAIRGEVFDGAEIFLRDSKNADPLWLSATGRPLLDEAGKIQGGVVVFSDISPRRVLEKQITEISDREQHRIGQDLHDSLCQHLVSVGFALEVLREKLEHKNLEEIREAERIADMVNDGISQARTVARGLYPVRLELHGLSSALEELSTAIQARNNVACVLSCDEAVLIHDVVAGNNLFRIAQEAVNNAVKHGYCRNISIGLGAVEDEVTLTVKDDGLGFPDEVEQGAGMGLQIMNYRAKMIGASLDIRRGAGGGTIVICSYHNEKIDKQREPQTELPLIPAPAAHVEKI